MRLNLKKMAFNSYFIGMLLCCIVHQNIALGSIAGSNENKQTDKPETPQLVDTNIVGKIDGYDITKQELEKRLILELQPDPYKLYTEQSKPKDANSMLMVILGEKAVEMEARKQGLLEDEMVKENIKIERQRRIVNLWVQYNIKKEHDKIAATEQEIEEQIKANPKLDKDNAKAAIESAKTNKILNQCYETLYKKSDVKKITANYPKVIEIHDRLLNHPVKPRNVSFIRDYQVKDELTDEEKNLVLATFTNGKITLQDWFDTLCDLSPPGRPKNLNTENGVEQILERTLSTPLIMADAHSLGLDTDPAFLKQMKNIEDEMLLNVVRNKKNEEVNEPTPEKILAFYNENKEWFFQNRFMKIDQIWCKDSETAQIARKELNSGKDFNDVKKEYSLFPESISYQATPNYEGYFWKEIWPGKPGDIIGPIKYFHSGEIKWCIVKIIEKNPGKQQEYSKELETSVKYLMMSIIADKNMEDYCLDTLKKYHYEIFSDRIKNIDPMNIP